MAEFPSLPLWTDAWVADTKHLTRAERGLYMDLLILMWRSPSCKVPNDDAWLSRRLNLTEKELTEELRPIISEFCKSDGNRVWQKRLQKEYDFCKRQSERRKGKKKNNNSDNQNSTAESAPTPIPTPTPTEEESSEFDAWYAAYPRRVDPGRAAKAYRTARKLASAADLLGGARRYAAECKGKDQQYVKHPSTWLSAQSWKNEPARGNGNSTTGPPHKPLGPAAGTPEDLEQRRRAGII